MHTPRLDRKERENFDVQEQIAIGCKQLKDEINKLKFTSGNSFISDLGMTKEQIHADKYV